MRANAKGYRNDCKSQSTQNWPFSESALPWWSKSFEAMRGEKVACLCETVDFMIPPVALSIAAALDDQTPEKTGRLGTQTQRKLTKSTSLTYTKTKLTYRAEFWKQTPYLAPVSTRPTFTLNSGSNSSTKSIQPPSRFMYNRKESFTTSQRSDQRKQIWWWPMQFRPWTRWPPDLFKMGPSLREDHT